MRLVRILIMHFSERKAFGQYNVYIIRMFRSKEQVLLLQNCTVTKFYCYKTCENLRKLLVSEDLLAPTISQMVALEKQL